MGVLSDTEADFKRNLSCLDSIVQMLSSIPEVSELFEEQSFKTGNRITDVCDEIHRVLKLNTDTADLRAVLGFQSQDADMLFSRQQNFEVVFFRDVHAAVRAELAESSLAVRNIWNKFTSGRFNFVEISERNTDSVGRFLDKTYSPEMLPDIMMVKIIYKPSSTKEFKLRSENRIQLKNGDIYRLTCIIDKDRSIGTYSTTKSHDGAWARDVKGRLRYFAEEDVKTYKNYAYIYVKQVFLSFKEEVKVKGEKMKNEHFCRVPGCPDDLGFPTEEILQDHVKQEHKRCSTCGKQFLLSSLHKEHILTCRLKSSPTRVKSEKKRRRPTDPDSGVESIVDEDVKITPFFKPKRKWMRAFAEDSMFQDDSDHKQWRLWLD